MPEPPQELDVLAYKIIGAAIEVHRLLGPGFLESVYEEALATELKMRNVNFERQKLVRIVYKTHGVGEHRLDFLIESELVVELKSVDNFSPLHKAQLISYLRAVHSPLGLLINFNEKWLKNGIQRVVLT